MELLRPPSVIASVLLNLTRCCSPADFIVIGTVTLTGFNVCTVTVAPLLFEQYTVFTILDQTLHTLSLS